MSRNTTKKNKRGEGKPLPTSSISSNLVAHSHCVLSPNLSCVPSNNGRFAYATPRSQLLTIQSNSQSKNDTAFSVKLFNYDFNSRKTRCAGTFNDRNSPQQSQTQEEQKMLATMFPRQQFKNRTAVHCQPRGVRWKPTVHYRLLARLRAAPSGSGSSLGRTATNLEIISLTVGRGGGPRPRPWSLRGGSVGKSGAGMVAQEVKMACGWSLRRVRSEWDGRSKGRIWSFSGKEM